MKTLFLLLITTMAAAAPVDLGPLFPILENSDLTSRAPDACTTGTAVSGKYGVFSFAYKDTSGNAALAPLDPRGNQVFSETDGTKATYSASITGLSAGVLPTDVFTITGSATKTVRITRVEFTGTITTGAVRDLLLIKRSTADSGGTSSSVTAVPHDSSSAAATATVLAYTTNPTLGTTVGTVRSVKTELPATNLSSSSSTLVWDFGVRPSQAVVLRGTSEVLAVNMNGVTANGDNLDISVEWTEE